MDEFWKCAGVAVIIFAILSGLGACSLGMGVGRHLLRKLNKGST
jgi:hypothetical protein